MNKNYDEIAIVGMSCRFPGAKNYLEYWDNLTRNINSVSEIPDDRWDWRDYFGSPESKENKTNIKWGGFIDDVDKFDPLFFKISPTEANYIDPQHKLFLQSTWHAIEDAGYNPRSLAGKNIGVYVGVSKNDYAELMREKQESIISFISTGTVHSIIANRVSYLLDFVGKSEVVDTACSSFMVALNNAIRDIHLGVCESAIVGGVNTILTPTMYISHSKSGMLSSDGVCRSFDENANGYVRGEGIGVVFLKPLKEALKDGDNIWGVVKGVAVRHGGKSNFLTAPKASSQASVISEALRYSNVDPSSISYIEAHGTGTPLGDPIEIEALKNAYKNVSTENGCGIGSVKTNIGHLESAAGVAGLIKILLAFKYKKIPKSLNFKKLNPYIKLENSPFFIVEKQLEWHHKKNNGINIPLRAGLSSFGMGGVNAHAILEEPPVTKKNRLEKNIAKKTIIPMSAKTEGQLKESVTSLLSHIKFEENILISDLAYTLTYGREAMESRVVFVANDMHHLQLILKCYLDLEYNSSVILQDTDNRAFTSDVKLDVEDEIARLWVSGEKTDWPSVESNGSNQRINLPVYPFKKMRCWFPESSLENKSRNDIVSDVQPSNNQQNEIFKISDYFIRDHVVKGENIVPGVKYLDMFHDYAEMRTASNVKAIKDIFWIQPIKVMDEVKPCLDFIESKKQGEFDVSLKVGDLTCCTGRVILGEFDKLKKRLNIGRLRERCTSQASISVLYNTFDKNGLNYGETFKVIQSCRYNKNEIICELNQSSNLTIDKTIETSMADGVFQSVAALYLLNNAINSKQLLPFYLNSFKIYEKIPKKCFVYARRKVESEKENVESYDMYICRDSGEIVAEFIEFVKRSYVKNEQAKEQPMQLLNYTSKWIKRELGMHSENLSAVLLFDNDKGRCVETRKEFKDSLTIQIKKGRNFKKVSNTSYIVNPTDINSFNKLWNALEKDNVQIEGIIYGWNLIGSKQLKVTIELGVKTILTISKSLILSKNVNKVRLIYLYYNDKSINVSIHSMIGGFSRTLAYENPNIELESIGVDVLDKSVLAKISYQELSCYTNAPLNEIRYENSIRKAKVIVSSTQNDGEKSILLKQQGSYLITGGCGGLGFIFAKYLARKYQANLVLVGRTEINLSIREKLDELSLLGGSPYYFKSDVSNKRSVQKLYSSLVDKNISLDGVMHCAGMIDDAFIVKKTQQSFDKVTSVKLQGAILLDEVAKNEKLDFYMVFSSIASIMPNQGQCDYAAANSFLDEFVNYRSRLTEQNERSGFSVSINWPLWRNGGIGVIKEEEEHLKEIFGMMPLENESGLKIFSNALSVNAGKLVEQVIAIEGDKTKIDKHLQTFNYSEQPEFLTTSDLLKHYVAQVQKEDKLIDDDESLTDFGVDSVGLVRLSKMINEGLGADIEPTIFFEFNSVRKVTSYLEKEFDSLIQNVQATNNYTQKRALVDLEQSNSSQLKFLKGYSQQEFFMRDHVVDGKYNVPGACYIEMAIECGEMIKGNSNVYKLTNNYWAKQLSTTGEVINVELKFVDKDEYYEYEISSSSSDETVLHALGQLYIGPDEFDFGEVDLDKIRSRCKLKRNSEEIYQFIHAEGLHVGSSFMPMIDIVLNEDEALSHLKLPDFISETSSDYVFHPSLLTGVLQTALLNNKPKGMDDTQFIPIAIDEIVFSGNIPDECFVYTQSINLDNSNDEISKFDAKVINTEGVIIVTIAGLTLRNLTPTKSINHNKDDVVVTREHDSNEDFTNQVENLLKDCLSTSIGLPSAEIEADVELDYYGINSVMIVELNRALGEIFGNLSKTLFFEYKSVKELAQYFISNHSRILTELLTVDDQLEVSNNNKIKDNNINKITEDDKELFVYDSLSALEPSRDSDEDIAIVGVSGRYPQARSLFEFWENLKEGKDSITDMPKWRFDFDKFYQETNDDSVLSGRWGGFVDDIDKFDPKFFNISPREAELIDPQERLFLEVAWETIENAGYNQESLRGRPIGVFVGALWQSYISLAAEQTAKGNIQTPSGLLYSIPNRVSFCFDWSGPSLAIDTACSSSLSALHFACESVKRGECDSALVGGVNLSFSSSKYLWLAKNKFLSSDGKCKSFGVDGDGYVPGEGVGAVYIKKLSTAIKDNDNIMAVIKSTSVNHGGKTNGYTVPNSNRQADLIMSSIDKSNVSVDQITYIEAHGTGTSLGDPIEISGIKKAFSTYTDKKYSCAIGSVKSNIGHLEAAAGIAGLTKILLQMKYKKLVPSLHSSSLNPNINFDDSSLKVQRNLSPWQRTNTKEGVASPYCAMVSSFGAGGSNANAIVEEYRKNDTSLVSFEKSIDDFIVPLSASDPERLKAYVKKILRFLEVNLDEEMSCKDYQDDTSYLNDLAYTLQVGRREMNERLVIIVKNIDELKDKLKHYLISSDKKIEGIYHANIKGGQGAFKLLSSDDQITKIFDDWLTEKKHSKIAELWISGINIDWKLLHSSDRCNRIEIPTYPFKMERFWIKEVESDVIRQTNQTVNNQTKLHPLLHRNTSDLYEQRYSSIFEKTDPFFVSSIDGKNRYLPNIICLEIVHSAIYQAIGKTEQVWSIKDVKWINPISISRHNKKIHTSLIVSDDDGIEIKSIEFEQYSISERNDNDKMIHVSGNVSFVKNRLPEKITIEHLKQKSSKGINDHEKFYQELSGFGIEYGNEYQVVHEFNLGQNWALAKINVPLSDTDKFNEFIMHPGLIESAIQTIMLLIAKKKSIVRSSKIEQIYLKYLDEICVISKCSHSGYCYIETIENKGDINSIRYNAYICDSDGNISIKMLGLSFNEALVSNNKKEILTELSVSDNDRKMTSSGISLIDVPIYEETFNTDAAKSKKIINLKPVKKEYTEIHEDLMPENDLLISKHEIQDFLIESLANALYINASELEIDKQFVDMGLDSIVGVEWLQVINKKYTTNIHASKVYDYPTINEFSYFIFQEINSHQPKKIHMDIEDDIVKLDDVIVTPPIIEQKTDSNSTSIVTSDSTKDFLIESLASALYLSVDDIEVDRSFIELGLDSIVGVEWMQVINNHYDCSINATKIYDYPSIHEFSIFLHTQINFNENASKSLVDETGFVIEDESILDHPHA